MSFSKIVSDITETISALTPNLTHPLSATTTRKVFETELNMVSVSKGLIVR